MSFRILGLDPAPFVSLYGLGDAALAARGVRRLVVDAMPGFPDRIELADVAPGEAVLLMNYIHQPAETAYRASHAIYVREFADTRYDGTNCVPGAIRRRTISLRAFSAGHEMLQADLVEGSGIEGMIEAMFTDPHIAYLHAHYAKPGCYAARIDRINSQD
jgi:hypothetical protein